MGFVARRQPSLPFETWPNLKAAAETRYWDAMALAVSESDRAAGAIYLFGYAAEMLLKAAYCQYNQRSPTDDMYTFLRGDRLTVHPVLIIATALIDARRISGNPMNAGVATDLVFHATLIDADRDVTMRYYDFPATKDELNDVLTSVEWMRENYTRMWR